MNTAKAEGAPSRSLRAEAAAWLAKLHGPERTPRLEADFQSWLKANPENARAFEQITETWDAITPATTAGLPRIAAPLSTLGEREGPAQREGEAIRRGWGPRSGRVRMLIAATTCAAATAIAIFWFSTGDHYTTAIGEQRIITLLDGTRLSLNSDTRIDVDLQKTQRHIILKRGEAYFEVTHDPSRPFIVTAGNRTVTALGTTFLVRYDPQITAVTLVEGKVTVAPAADANPPSPRERRGAGGEALSAGTAEAVTLSPGERLTFAPTGTASIDIPKPETTAAWRRGEVILDDTPLRAAATEMNRYERQHLVIDDPEVAKLPVSGIYKTGDTIGFAHAVATVYGLQITTSGEETHLHR